MPSKPRFLCMNKDDAIWEKLDDETDEWLQGDVQRDLILKYKPGQPEVMHPMIKGGYNVVYRLEYKDASSVILRIPIKGVVPFRDEKVRYEVATMRYIGAHTTIPVPHIYHHGDAVANPTGLGPFIIMDYVDHHQNMSRELLDPTRPIHERPVLDPKISEEMLEMLYEQMANILLQLSTLKFPRIGSLAEEDDSRKKVSVTITRRPLTSNMNDIVVHTNAPPDCLPNQAYDSAEAWHAALADMHMVQLTCQQNDAVEDEDDARDKYAARQIFRTLARDREKRLVSDSGIVKQRVLLFSEDFRPTNVLLDKDLHIVSVIDWEFAYAAPAQFSYDPPWWLLLEEPEYWEGGYEAWRQVYEPRLQTFLRVLQREEDKLATKSNGAADNSKHKQATLEECGKDDDDDEKTLSRRMRESWDQGTWMVNYAARKSWAFDFIWWKYLDERYFGPNEDQDHHARLDLLSKAQREAMDGFVAHKMNDLQHGKSEGDTVDLHDRLAGLLC